MIIDDKMVEPNIQATIGTPIDFYKFEVLRNVINVNEAMESFSKNDAQGIPVENHIIRARVQSLFNSLVAYLKRKLEDNDYTSMKYKLFDQPIVSNNELREIYWRIQTQLDIDNITKMDTRRQYDGTRVEKENANFGD